MESNIFFRFFLHIFAISYLLILILLPLQWYKIGYYSEIFPAIDLMVIYYLCTHENQKIIIKSYSQAFILFFAGIFIDQLQEIPIGTSSISFILGKIMLKKASKHLILNDYYTNIISFIAYAIFVSIIRYFSVSINNIYSIEGVEIYFHFIMTIATYPIFYFVINFPFKILHNNAT